MNILITICARGGSKGVPGKNIALINSLPLIVYTINSASKFANSLSKDHNAKIALSTDDELIKKIAADYGLKTDYLRQSELATDSMGKIAVIKDLMEYHEAIEKSSFDIILDLDVTSPLRTLEDLTKAYHHFNSTPNALNSFSVSPANRNPYFNMIESKDGLYAHKSKNLKGDIYTRQSAPKVYDLNASFYFYRRDFYSQNYSTVFTPRTIFHVLDHICFDIDHPLDLEVLDFLISNNKLNFEI